MEELWPYITYFISALIFVLILKFVFKFGIKTIVNIVINIIVGGIVLFLINLVPFINLPINAINALITGIFGVPGVIFIIIYYYFIGS